MPIQPIDTHYQDALDRLMTQYRGQPQIALLIQCTADQVQALEDATQDVYTKRWLTNASGAQLDGIGALRGLSRNGLDDATYKALIYGVIGQNYSNGTMPSLVSTARHLFLAQAIFKKDVNSQGAGGSGMAASVAFGIGSLALPDSELSTVRLLLQKALPVGVGLFYISRFNAAGAFACAGPQAWVKGFGDVNDASVGGPLADCLYNNPSV